MPHLLPKLSRLRRPIATQNRPKNIAFISPLIKTWNRVDEMRDRSRKSVPNLDCFLRFAPIFRSGRGNQYLLADSRRGLSGSRRRAFSRRKLRATIRQDSGAGIKVDSSSALEDTVISISSGEGFTTYAERRIFEALQGEERAALSTGIGWRGLCEEVERFKDNIAMTKLLFAAGNIVIENIDNTALSTAKEPQEAAHSLSPNSPLKKLKLKAT